MLVSPYLFRRKLKNVGMDWRRLHSTLKPICYQSCEYPRPGRWLDTSLPLGWGDYLRPFAECLLRTEGLFGTSLLRPSIWLPGFLCLRSKLPNYLVKMSCPCDFRLYFFRYLDFRGLVIGVGGFRVVIAGY